MTLALAGKRAAEYDQAFSSFVCSKVVSFRGGVFPDCFLFSFSGTRRMFVCYRLKNRQWHTWPFLWELTRRLIFTNTSTKDNLRIRQLKARLHTGSILPTQIQHPNRLSAFFSFDVSNSIVTLASICALFKARKPDPLDRSRVALRTKRRRCLYFQATVYSNRTSQPNNRNPNRLPVRVVLLSSSAATRPLKGKNATSPLSGRARFHFNFG